MAYELKTFSDIYSAVMEELKYQLADTNNLNKIKRDINMIYADVVVPHAQWEWLRGTTTVTVNAYYATGTVAVTNGSATVTLTNAPSTSKTGYWFSVDGYSEVFKISAHTGASTTATLAAAYTGSTVSGQTFKIWSDAIALPADCSEILQVTHAFRDRPVEGVGISQFRQIVTTAPRVVARPSYYSENGDDTNGRSILIYPSLTDQALTMQVEYLKEVTSLSADADQPLIPVADRIVLFYGACSKAWKRERNPEAMGDSEGHFAKKLQKMAARFQSAMDFPQLQVSKIYLNTKRSVTGQQRVWSNRWWKIN